MTYIQSRLGGWNWNRLFAYHTNKTVQITDYRLGIIRFVLLLAILIYVLCDIFIHQRYNVKEPLVPGVVQTSLSAPTTINAADYCTHTSCVYWSPNQVLYPNTDGSELFITTGIRFANYALPPNCINAVVPNAQFLLTGQTFAANITSNETRPDLVSDANCLYTLGPRTVTPTYFVAGIEQFVINVEHFVYNLKDNTLLSSAALPGALMKTNEGDSMEQILRHYDQKQSANQTTRADLLPINDLLSAAGISLNNVSRTNGLVLFVRIDYDNHGELVSNVDDASAQYTYHPQMVNLPSATRVEIRRNPDGTVTEVLRQGIRVVFQQSGVFSHFDFMTLLIHFGTILLLTWLAIWLVEFIMLYVLPERGEYASQKYANSDIQKTRNMELDTASFDTEHHSAVLASAVGALSPSERARRHISVLRVTNPPAGSLYTSSSETSVSVAIPVRTHSLPAPPHDKLSGLESESYMRDDNHLTVMQPTNEHNTRMSDIPKDADDGSVDDLLDKSVNSMVSIELEDPVVQKSHYCDPIHEELSPSQIPPSPTSSIEVNIGNSTYSTSIVYPNVPPQSMVTLPETSSSAPHTLGNTSEDTTATQSDNLNVQNQRRQRVYQYAPPTPARNTMMTQPSSEGSARASWVLTYSTSSSSQHTVEESTRTNSIPTIVVHDTQNATEPRSEYANASSSALGSTPTLDQYQTDTSTENYSDRNQSVGGSDSYYTIDHTKSSQGGGTIVDELNKYFDTSDVILTATVASEGGFVIQDDSGNHQNRDH